MQSDIKVEAQGHPALFQHVNGMNLMQYFFKLGDQREGSALDESSDTEAGR